MDSIIPSHITALIFDVDGTLIDSNDAHTHAWLEALTEADFVVDFEDIRPLIGMGGDKLLPELTGIDAESAKGKELSKRRGEIFRSRYLSTLQAFPGTRDLLLALHDGGFRLGIASSASEKDLSALLRQAGVDDIFAASQRTSADDAERSKPDPDIVRAALERVKAAPGEALMIGDTPYDIEAAERAGLGGFAFRCGGYWRDPAFARARAIYDGPRDLLEQWLGPVAEQDAAPTI